jgi:hypothetical protein
MPQIHDKGELSLDNFSYLAYITKVWLGLVKGLNQRAVSHVKPSQVKPIVLFLGLKIKINII